MTFERFGMINKQRLSFAKGLNSAKGLNYKISSFHRFNPNGSDFEKFCIERRIHTYS